MFELGMNAIRRTAALHSQNVANVANRLVASEGPANRWLIAANEVANSALPEPGQPEPLAKLAGLAALAISHDQPTAANDPPPLAELATLAGLAISQELMEARLIAAAMRAADHHGDGPEAREQWRQDVLATPHHLCADLLEHLQAQYPPG